MGFPFSTIGEDYFHFDDVGLTFPKASKMSSVAFLIHCPIAILTAFEVWLPFFLRKLEITTGYESLHLFFRKHSSQWNRLQVLTHVLGTRTKLYYLKHVHVDLFTYK